MSPVFTPRATIQNRTDMGNVLLKQAMKGQQNVSALSPYTNLAQGLAGGFLRGSANRFERSNDALRNQTLDEVRNAPDGASMGRILINSADPRQREFGMMQMIKEQQAAARKAVVDRAHDLEKRRIQALIDADARRNDAAQANADGARDPRKHHRGMALPQRKPDEGAARTRTGTEYRRYPRRAPNAPSAGMGKTGWY